MKEKDILNITKQKQLTKHTQCYFKQQILPTDQQKSVNQNTYTSLYGLLIDPKVVSFNLIALRTDRNAIYMGLNAQAENVSLGRLNAGWYLIIIRQQEQ